MPGLVRLLTPPFDKTTHDPGYMKGYVPGVGENGGQYTHAALWVVKALAESGRPERATRLLEMLNPIHHARTPAEVAVYQVEPYVVAADVYGRYKNFNPCNPGSSPSWPTACTSPCERNSNGWRRVSPRAPCSISSPPSRCSMFISQPTMAAP